LQDAQPRPSQSSNFIAKHWRGEYSLGVSYWLFGFLLTLLIIGLSLAIDPISDAIRLGPQGHGVLIVGYYLGILAVSVWQFVGVFRSASAHVSRGGKAFWAILAKALVCLGAIQMAISVITDGVPILREGVDMIRGTDNVPPYALRLMRNDTELEVAGGPAVQHGRRSCQPAVINSTSPVGAGLPAKRTPPLLNLPANLSTAQTKSRVLTTRRGFNQASLANHLRAPIPQQLATLLTSQPADDLDRLMNPRRGTKAQLGLVLALQLLVMSHQRFAEQFEGPDVALEGGEAFVVSHGAPALGLALGCPGCGWGRSGGRPEELGGGERMRGSLRDFQWSCMSSFRCGTTTARGQAS